MIPTSYYLVLSLVLFCIGVVGMVVRRNFITVLMCVELILNAANHNFVAFAQKLGDLTGQRGRLQRRQGRQSQLKSLLQTGG